eukprot:2321999-Rhodomonas_salina.3
MASSLTVVLPCVLFFVVVGLPQALPSSEGAPGRFTGVRELSVHISGASILSSASTGTSDLLFGIPEDQLATPTAFDGAVVRATLDSGNGDGITSR